MRWTPGGTSKNIEDRRGSGGMGGGFGGGGFGGGGMVPTSIGGAILLLVLSLLFGRGGGGDNEQPQVGADQTRAPGAVMPDSVAGQTAGGEVSSSVNESPAEAREVQFVSFVLDSAQSVWARLVPQDFGKQYRDAKLVLFRDGTRTACGVGQTAMGPFYCPNDEKVYLDLAFFDELKSRFGAPGEFAQAYVVAHELGHHVQKVTGIEQQVRQAQERYPDQANDLSVRLELQADCFAGVFGHEMKNRGILDPKDLEDGLNAASAVGDDRLQQETTGRVTPDSFTHGTSAQRSAWFRKGFDSGDPRMCDTFGAGRFAGNTF